MGGGGGALSAASAFSFLMIVRRSLESFTKSSTALSCLVSFVSPSISSVSRSTSGDCSGAG